MGNGFLVADGSKTWRGKNPDLPGLLESRGLYKSLSLVLAHREEIKVPPSLLLLAARRELVNEFAQQFGLPLMIRVDYQSRPNAKPLGGIPLHSLEIVERVCGNLLEQACLPLLHPNLDRFEDLFSAGLLFTQGSDDAEVEVVGKGFDAGDLRLGKAIPHENFLVDMTVGATKRHRIIDDDSYRRQREIRRQMVRRLKAYVHFVNQSGRLLGDLETFNQVAFQPPDLEPVIPLHYGPMPSDVLNQLLRILPRIKSGVVHRLPRSKAYVASMSCLPGEGWVLWDVYGDWYFR